MLAVGMLAIWLGYSTSLWGWCLLRDYNVTMAALVNPVHPYAGKWPPPKLDNTVVWPGGRSAVPGPGQPGYGQSATTPGGITVNPPGGGIRIPFGGFPIPIPLSQKKSGTVQPVADATGAFPVIPPGG